MRHLTIYGDFNCPYSYLASVRADDLVRRGLVTVDWRAVEHAPSIPSAGCPMRGEVATQLTREIGEVANVAGDAMPLPLRIPTVLPNTAAAVLAFAGTDPAGAAALRERIFAAFWAEGRDIGSRAELSVLTGGHEEWKPAVVARWREAWLGIDQPVVPLLMLPTGIVLRGADALERLELIGAGGLAERRRRLLRSHSERPAVTTGGDDTTARHPAMAAPV